MQLSGDRGSVAGAEGGSGGERARVVAHGELFDLGEQRLEIGVRTWQLLVEPGSGRIGGERGLVRQVDSGVVGRTVGTQVEVQDLRKQDDAVQVDRALTRQL